MDATTTTSRITLQVNCVVNRKEIEAARQFPKLVLILEEQIERRKGMEDKVASLAQDAAVPVILLLDVILF